MDQKNNISSLKYRVVDGFDKIIDEKGASFIALRKIQWGVDQNDESSDKEPKLDLRKYYNTPSGERMSKGVSFLTEEGPSELINVLLDEGYGKTTDVLSRIMSRDDFKDSVDEVINGKEDISEDFFDPREVLFA